MATRSSASSSLRSLPTTVVVYHYFAHYRAPVMRALTRYWDRAGSRLSMISDRTSNLPSLTVIDPVLAETSVNDGGFHWTFIKNLWLGRRFLWQRGLLRLAWRRGPEVLILLGNPYFLTNWLAVPVARWRGKRILFWTHGVNRSESGWRKRLRYRYLQLADGLLLYGNWARDRLLRDHVIPADRMHVVFNSLDHQAHRRLREQLTPQAIAETRQSLFPDHADDPLLLFTGRLTPTKRLDALIAAMARLGHHGRRLNLVIIGDGPQRQPLSKQVADLSLSAQVRFIGACYDEERLVSTIGAADLTVVPCHLGLAAIHSMSCGTPVLTHDDPEHHGPEFEAVIPGETGCLYARGDDDALVQAIEAWTSQPRDREAVRHACHRVVENWFTPEAQTERIARAVNGAPAVEERVSLPPTGESKNS